MIKNVKILEEFENEIIRNEKPDFYKNLKIVKELHNEALKIGAFTKDPLYDIETDIRVAKVVNNVGKTS